MSQNHKEEKVILFNYESHTCIIDRLPFFLQFFFSFSIAGGILCGLLLAVWNNAWHSPRCQHLLVAGLAEASNGGLQVTPNALFPLWSLCYCVWSSRAPDTLRSRRVHAGVSEGCGGMSVNVWEPANTEADRGLVDRWDSEESMQPVTLLVSPATITENILLAHADMFQIV